MLLLSTTYIFLLLVAIYRIHTHPSQTCFLSSIDLHTHYGYQLMLAEAIAIVLAPTAKPDHGVFHCTPGGMKALSKCNRGGFHQHQETFPLYQAANHIIWQGPEVAVKFIDLR